MEGSNYRDLRTTSLVSQKYFYEVSRMTQPVLSVKNLNVSFDLLGELSPAVQNISFDIRPRTTVAVVGESGSGKSVTALSIMRLLPDGSHFGGEVFLNGRSLFPLSETDMRKVRGNEIAMIFQEPMTSLNPTLTAGYQISEALMCHRAMDRHQADAEAIRLLDRVRIPSAKARFGEYPHRMSGGMRQRVMIAMALACKPKLLIADEPTTALDVTVQATILQLLRDLQQEDEMSILFITHDIGVVAEIADETIVMLKGDIVEKGATSSVFTKPVHTYTRNLLSVMPQIGSMAGHMHPMSFATVDIETGLLNPPREITDTVFKGKPILEVNNLVKRYDVRSGLLNKLTGQVHAIDDISFHIRPGETLALVGESGCGKSTTGRCILGLTEPSGGSIQIDGQDILSVNKPARREILRQTQMIFQDPYASLNPRMCVGDSVAEPIVISGNYKSQQIRERVLVLLENVGLSADVYDRYPHEFSGGQRQRLCIARALSLNPKLIVADEAVSALDASIKAQVINLMLDLQEKFKLAFLFISHDMAVVERVSHRVAIMYLGEIVEMGDRACVFGNPQHPYTKRLLASVPRAQPRQQSELRLMPGNSELPSAIRPLSFKAPIRHYRQVSANHQVQEWERESDMNGFFKK